MLIFEDGMPRPLLTDPDTRPFWDASREHRLVVQQCGECGAFRFAPVPLCYNCNSFDVTWSESAGTGEIYTWTVTHSPILPAAASSVPFNTIVVKLDDCGGALITSNLVNASNDEIRAGLPVRVVWDDVSDEYSLPRFEPAERSS